MTNEYISIKQKCIDMCREVRENLSEQIMNNESSAWVEYDDKDAKAGEMLDTIDPKDGVASCRIFAVESGYIQYISGRTDSNATSGGCMSLTILVAPHREIERLVRRLFGDGERKALEEIRIKYYTVHRKDKMIEEMKFKSTVGVVWHFDYKQSASVVPTSIAAVAFRTDEWMKDEIKKEAISGSGVDISAGRMITTFYDSDSSRRI